jgi:hypothetical protein
MASIEQQIRDAVPKWLARASELNDRSMDEYEGEPWRETVDEFIARAIHNLHDAEDILCELEDEKALGDDCNQAVLADLMTSLLDDLCDAPNLCALALSLLPSEEADHAAD